MNWELLACAWEGHALVGTDAAVVRDGDASVARPDADDPARRWHRCLRCDAWVSCEVPAEPGRRHLPAGDEVVVPLRGRALRDRFVLRLIALDRVVHVVALSLLGAALLVLLEHRESWAPVVATLHGLAPGSTLIVDLERVLGLPSGRLALITVAVFAYAALEAVEAVGLWFARRWAEYLTLVATTVLFVPEVYELAHGTTVTKVLALLVNVAVVAYLLATKGLFGLPVLRPALRPWPRRARRARTGRAGATPR